jgi:hypothetical protein
MTNGRQGRPRRRDGGVSVRRVAARVAVLMLVAVLWTLRHYVPAHADAAVVGNATGADGLSVPVIVDELLSTLGSLIGGETHTTGPAHLPPLAPHPTTQRPTTQRPTTQHLVIHRVAVHHTAVHVTRAPHHLVRTSARPRHVAWPSVRPRARHMWRSAHAVRPPPAVSQSLSAPAPSPSYLPSARPSGLTHQPAHRHAVPDHPSRRAGGLVEPSLVLAPTRHGFRLTVPARRFPSTRRTEAVSVAVSLPKRRPWVLRRHVAPGCVLPAGILIRTADPTTEYAVFPAPTLCQLLCQLRYQSLGRCRTPSWRATVDVAAPVDRRPFDNWIRGSSDEPG